MSEEEIIEMIKDIINRLKQYNFTHTEQQALQGLLDLYQKEKEKNKLMEETLIRFAEEREKLLKTPVISKNKIRELISKYKLEYEEQWSSSYGNYYKFAKDIKELLEE